MFMFHTFVRQETATKTKQKNNTLKETQTTAKKLLLLVAKTLATAKKPRRR